MGLAQIRAALLAALFGVACCTGALAQSPATGIGGVYEVMVGTHDGDAIVRYFAEFGFRVVDEGSVSADRARELYGVDSALKSWRLQSGAVSSHGLLRVLQWAEPLGPGVGYAPAETVGQRMAVMRTADIFRLADVFEDARAGGEQWSVTPPVYDDLYGMSDKAPGFFERRIGVREGAVYGEFFNHVFFQRYGYTIPGYGTINPDAPLRTSEFTHHDFIIKGDIDRVTAYYSDVLGLRREKPPVLDGDWQTGPRVVFQMKPGTSHWYVGFVSPNNICGKLKFFVPRDIERDRSAAQRVGEMGITLHSFTTPKLKFVHELAREAGLAPSAIAKNEFGERSFFFVGPDGASWQIIEAGNTSAVTTELKFERTGG